ncbi:MAG: ankyrin repeat domain-containing protein [Chlamydiota bacterium]
MFNFEANHLVTDLEEPQEDLGDDVHSVVRNLEDKNSFFFLGAVLKTRQSNTHYRCLVTSPTFKKEQKAIKRAKKKNFYLIESESEHFLLQLLGLLHVAKKYTIEALYSSPYLCRNCHLLALHLFEIRLPLNEKGCFGTPFPSSEKMPTSAMAYINNHLTLPLVKQLVVPMMGYVKGDEVQALRKIVAEHRDELKVKDQEILSLRKQLQRKDQQLRSQEREMTNLQIALTQKVDEIAILQERAKNKVQIKKEKYRNPLDKETKEKWWVAIKENDERTVKHILAHYMVDVNAKDDNGKTPLHRAAWRNSKEVAEILIRAGADVNAKNEYENTPLHDAASRNNKEVTEILIRAGADVNAKDEDGWTPLHYAVRENCKEVAETLIKEGADVNATDNQGWTPLHWAAWYNSKEVAKLLITAGADKNVRTIWLFGQTPLDVAKGAWFKDQKMIGLLKRL